MRATAPARLARPGVSAVHSAWSCDGLPLAHRRAAARGHRSSGGGPRQLAAPWASPVFGGDVLQGPHIQGEIGHHLLEFPVLLLELAPPPQLADLEPAVLRFPALVGPLAHAELTAHVGDRLARLHPLQDPNDLLFAESALPHGICSLPSKVILSYFPWTSSWGEGHNGERVSQPNARIWRRSPQPPYQRRDRLRRSVLSLHRH